MTLERSSKLHKEAMDLADQAFVAKTKGMLSESNQLIRESFNREQEAASYTANNLELAGVSEL